MNILFEKNLPTKELSRAKLMMEIRTRLYYALLLVSSLSFRASSFEMRLVSEKAKNRLTAKVQRLIITCKRTIRAIPPTPPNAKLKNSL